MASRGRQNAVHDDDHARQAGHGRVRRLDESGLSGGGARNDLATTCLGAQHAADSILSRLFLQVRPAIRMARKAIALPTVASGCLPLVITGFLVTTFTILSTSSPHFFDDFASLIVGFAVIAGGANARKGAASERGLPAPAALVALRGPISKSSGRCGRP